MMEGKKKKMINNNVSNPKKRIEFFKVYYDRDTYQCTDAYPKKEFLIHVLINLTMGVVMRNMKEVDFHTINVHIFSSLSNLSFLASIGLSIFNFLVVSLPVLWIVAGLCALVALASAFYAANDIIQMRSEYYGYTTNPSLPACKYEKLDKYTIINFPIKYEEIEVPKGAINDINSNIDPFDNY